MGARYPHLPTMYDLPSEDPEEPGLPDEFHDFQPDLLTQTCQSPHYPREDYFIASDLNLYYDLEHTRWYKRPDWFLVLGVPQSRTRDELRWSYLIWQEEVSPFLVVELASPGTEDEDLGLTERQVNRPPTKWEVYEQILQIPYYAIYDRSDNRFRGFHLEEGEYKELELWEGRLWFEELGLGLGQWQGRYEGVEMLWLRFYDAGGNWIPTPEERANIERERAERERERANLERERANLEREKADRIEAILEEERRQKQALLELLRQQGVDPDTLL
ncbi:MAG: Uma2 family endonuclease [Spirulina sp.]